MRRIVIMFAVAILIATMIPFNYFHENVQAADSNDYELANLYITKDAVSENMKVFSRTNANIVKKENDFYENFLGTASHVIDYGGRYLKPDPAKLANGESNPPKVPVFEPGKKITSGGLRIEGRRTVWDEYLGDPEVLFVDYDHVGFIELKKADESSQPIYKDIGARLKISNIILGNGPRWRQKNITPRIELSNNFYSGIFYEFILSMDLEVEFYERGNPDKVISFNGSNGNFSFLSLNGYGYSTGEWGMSNLVSPARPLKQVDPHWHEIQDHYDRTYEFAGSLDGHEGILSENTKLNFYKRSTTPHASNTYHMNPYAQNKVNPEEIHPDLEFDDRLGGVDFLDSGVTFPLKGSKNRFKIGSTYGYTWNAFMSTAVVPVKHRAPSKTVQTLKNSKGSVSGYSNRFDNDLDRYHWHGLDEDNRKIDHFQSEMKEYNQEIKFWDLAPRFWKDGHNPFDLSSNVLPVLERFVQTGQEHYYFINQEISIASDSLVLPTRIIFEDQLPEGVHLSTGTLQDLTFYNIDGREVRLQDSQLHYDKNTNKVKFVVEGRDLNTVIETVNSTADDGELSLRMKVKVDRLATGDINKDSMTNQAQTIFDYGNVKFERNTNYVQTAVRNLKIEKQWDDQDDLYKIRPQSIQVELLKKNKDQWDIVGEYTLSEQNGWTTIVDSRTIGVGEYKIREKGNEESPYEVKYSPVQSLSESQLLLQLSNKIMLTNLKFDKKDELGNLLYGAKFEIYKKSSDGSFSKIDRKINEENGHFVVYDLTAGDYYLKEVVAPLGYELSQKKYPFTINKKNGKLSVQKGDGWSSGAIVNKLKPFNIKFKKVDQDGNALNGVEFTLQNKETNALHTAISNEEGNLVFEKIVPGSYVFKESKALEGYEPFEEAIEFHIQSDGTVTVNHESFKDIQVTLNNDDDLNVIEFKKPIVNMKEDYILEIEKVDSETKQALEGARFQLLDKDENLLEEKTSNKEGKITFENLARGTYWLKEVQSPDGYNLLTKPIEIIIDGQQQVTTLTVENEKGNWSLPNTGGIGTLLFYLVGGLIILLGLFMLFRKNK